jgi:hypothetical protein
MTRTALLAPALAAGVLLAALLDAAYYAGGIAGRADDTPLRATAVATAGALLAAGAVWLAARRPAARPGRRALVLAACAALSFLGFWIGIFGPICAAAALGGREALAAGHRTAGRLALAAAALAAAAAAVLCLLGGS